MIRGQRRILLSAREINRKASAPGIPTQNLQAGPGIELGSSGRLPLSVLTVSQSPEPPMQAGDDLNDIRVRLSHCDIRLY